MNRPFLFLFLSILFASIPLLTKGSRLLLQGASVEIDRSNVDQFQSLLQKAEPGTTFILLADTIQLQETLRVTVPRTTIQGLSAESRPTVTCNGTGIDSVRIIVDAKEVEISDLVLEGCSGPALRIINSRAVKGKPLSGGLKRVKVRNVRFVGNVQSSSFFKPSNDGGAMQVSQGTDVSVLDCEFYRNSGTIGGAIRVFRSVNLTIENSTFIENQASLAGGAIYLGASHTLPGTRSRFAVNHCTFQRNKDLDGFEDRLGLLLANGAPLESNEIVRFPTPRSAAGAIFVGDFSKVVISSCLFENNTAVTAGGALFIGDNRQTTIKRCRFIGNGALPQFPQNNASELVQGGAVYVAFADERSTIDISNSSFLRNTAVYGGGLHLVGPLETKASIEDCNFDENYAVLGGGGMVIRNIIQMEVRDLKFRQNRARLGGGLLLTNGAGILMLQGVSSSRNCLFLENEALDGAGCYFLATGTVLIQAGNFTGNRAVRFGGGATFIESIYGGSIALQDTVFHDNSARIGGGIYQEATSVFAVYSLPRRQNLISRNHALIGGGLYLQPSGRGPNQVGINRVTFKDNEAVGDLESLPQLSEPLPTVDVSTLKDATFFEETTVQNDAHLAGGGGGLCLGLLPLFPRGSVDITVQNSLITNNTASNGGGLLISRSSSGGCVERCPVENTNGPATFELCDGINFQEVSFATNQATNRGSNILYLENEQEQWICQSSLESQHINP